MSSTDQLPKDVKFFGAIVESSSRVDYLLKQGGTEMMLTVWDLKTSKSQTVVAEEAFNQTVAGDRAILTLTVARGTRDCLWKVLWWVDGISFEFYVADKLTRGHPDRTPREIVAMAADLYESAKRR